MTVPEEEIIKNCIGLSAEEIKLLSYKQNHLAVGYQYFQRYEAVCRLEYFEKNIIPELHYSIKAYAFCNSFIIYGHKYGTLAYYPLKDSIFVCEKSVWLKNKGIEWIESNLI